MAVQNHHGPQNSHLWYVDTSYNNHMCGNKSSFSYLNEDFHSIVSFGDCSAMNVIGKGDINIKTKNGFIETLMFFMFPI
jgi:hypothetical protein